MNPNEVKFLIIRFSSIGDIVLTSPVIRCLKKQVKGASVHYLTKPQYASILEANTYVDKVHILKGFSETIEELRNEGFDYIIDLHNNLRSYRFKNKLKVMDFSFPKLNREKWLLVNFKKNKLPNKHIVDRYFETLNVFDVKNDNKGLEFFVEKENEISLNEIGSEKYVAFAIGGQHFTKKLPTNKIIEICNKINFPVVLLGGKEDFEIGEMVSSKSANAINLCGKYNLSQSASIVSKAGLVISHDTGLMHIAAAFKKDILSVWGNTVPVFGMYPYLAGKNSHIFEVENLKCRPCTKIGYEKCPKKHFNCMENQNVEKIAALTNEILTKNIG